MRAASLALVFSALALVAACGSASNVAADGAPPSGSKKVTGKGGAAGKSQGAGGEGDGSGAGGDGEGAGGEGAGGGGATAQAGGAAQAGAGGAAQAGAAQGGQGQGATAGAGATPTDEVCGNGLDDNKNGVIDDGCPCMPGATQACSVADPSQAGKGACVYGTQTCLEGDMGAEFRITYWGPCKGWGKPEVEACDGVDNDCDGTIDNGCSCADGATQACSSACGAGQQLCQGGAWGPCDAKQPTPEVCDNIDNDCDGMVDEQVERPCSTACGSGVEACNAGVFSGCTAPATCEQPCGSGLVCQGLCCSNGGACCNDGSCPDASGKCPSICDGIMCGSLCCLGALFCCADGTCPLPFLNICPGDGGSGGAPTCNTVTCNGDCCPAGDACCADGSCPDGSGQCPPTCSGVTCSGQCCSGASACCDDGSCPDANGQCPTPCGTVVCLGACCPSGAACCANGACPDPLSGVCSPELDQCQGAPEAEVYAHSDYTLYRVNPDTKAVTKVGSLDCGASGFERVFDIAIDRLGQMYGTTSGSLVKINKSNAACTTVTSGTYPNSLSFVPKGTVYADEEALVGYSGGQYLVIDKATGDITYKGKLPDGYSSSGDVVSIAGVGTYLTVNGNECEPNDCLLEVDPVSGAMIKNLGPVGHGDVWGLAFWKGSFYGFTAGGEIFTYDLASGQTQDVPIPGNPSLSFNGAGTTTCAPQQ